MLRSIRPVVYKDIPRPCHTPCSAGQDHAQSAQAALHFVLIPMPAPQPQARQNRRTGIDGALTGRHTGQITRFGLLQAPWRRTVLRLAKPDRQLDGRPRTRHEKARR
ncbi:hypothetical protein THUN1379_00090 [Paludibacterium sp. THUN1379]|nr:hypothetical protein THUN1379_00090 [Paludibacterium sp. THUN1379]